LNPDEVDTSTGTRTLDSGYTEWTTWDASYVALPFRGFARHVLGARFSALYRSGPGAEVESIGGVSGAGLGLMSLLDDVGGSSRFLPVRGFESGTRFGTRAWTASAEYRFPVALVTRSLAPLPLFLDRLAGSLFLDAGHAWCPPTLRCPSDSPSDAPLLSAGAEATGFFSLWGGALPVRLGVGFPLQGPTRTPRLHLATGAAF
jgi:outer membrane protein assembly factor BamA